MRPLDYHQYLTKLYVGGVIVLAMYGWNIELHLRTSVWYFSDWIG